MFYNRGWWGRPIGFILVSIGIGMLITTFFASVWLCAILAFTCIGVGLYLINSCC